MKKFLLNTAIIMTCGFNISHAETILKFWSFTDEVKPIIADFEGKNPDIKIDFTMVALEDYLSKIRPALKDRKNAPDIFTAEAMIIKEFVDRSIWTDISKEFAEYKDNMVPYVWNVGTDEKGKLRATSWQATAGGFFYRRSLAKKYLGSDDPKIIGDMIDTWPEFMAIAEKIKQNSNGEVKMIAGVEGISHAFFASRKSPWVNKNNEFIFDPKMDEFLNISREMSEKDITGSSLPFSPSWIAGLSNNKVFGYFLPTWGLHHVIKKNATETSGDWAVTQGPSPYFWGGTWVGVNSKSKHQEAAIRFVKMLTVDNEYMEAYGRKTGDFLSNIAVEEKLIKELDDPFLNGQNAHKFFSEAAQSISSTNFTSLMTKYDRFINEKMEAAAKGYSQGLSKEKVLNDFYNIIQTTYPKIKFSQR